MSNARLAVFEDDPFLQKLIDEIFYDTDHEIHERASSLAGALAVVGKIAAKESDCNVVILDGNLCKGATCCTDATKIVETIRDQDLDLKIISFSGELLLGEHGMDIDYEVKKPNAHELPIAVEAVLKVISLGQRGQPIEYASHLDRSALAVG